MARRLAVGALLGLLLGAGAVAALPRVADELPEPLADVARMPERLWTRVFPPRVSDEARLAGLTEPERAAVATLARQLEGLLVWSSNRSGNHELYLLDLGTRTVRQLTHHPHVDFFSRISPDGRHIVFLRSQREWVSFREGGAWDVHVIRVDGTEERRIVRGGYHPTWTADGSGIVFQRGPRFLRYDLATGRETLLLDWKQAVPALTEAGDVELSPDGRRLAFGVRGPFSGAAVYDLEARRFTPLTQSQACQTTWTPDGERVAWIDAGGRGGTRVMWARPDGSDRRVLVDLPGAHSHEYFPALSNDGRWLVWGASAKGHEHDRADYEIFVLDLGGPGATAVRLTHHPGNDQWPDLWVPPRG